MGKLERSTERSLDDQSYPTFTSFTSYRFLDLVSRMSGFLSFKITEDRVLNGGDSSGGMLNLWLIEKIDVVIQEDEEIRDEKMEYYAVEEVENQQLMSCRSESVV